MAKIPKGRGASVEVVFSDGQSLRKTVEVPEGDTQRPLSRDSLDRKFASFAVRVVGSEAAKRILALVSDLDGLKDVRELTSVLKGSGQPASP